MLTNSVYQEEHIPTQFERFWRSFRSNNITIFALWCLILIIVVTIIAPWIAPYDPLETVATSLTPPSWDSSGTIEFFLGTDEFGRDIMSRLLMGARFSFASAVCISFFAALIGSIIGISAGLSKGVLSSTLHHIFDTILAIPSLLLVIVFIIFFGANETVALLAIGFSLVPRFIHALYIAVHAETEKDYFLASRLDGANKFHLFYSSIFPNILVIIVTEITLALSIALLDITALGFMNLGIAQHNVEWGVMLGQSINFLTTAPWTVTLPGLTIMFTVIVINLVGDGIKQALNSGIE